MRTSAANPPLQLTRGNVSRGLLRPKGVHDEAKTTPISSPDRSLGCADASDRYVTGAKQSCADRLDVRWQSDRQRSDHGCIPLPAIYEWTFFVQSGGLVSYGADVLDIYRRAAGVVDKILKGAQPAELPVERPTRVDTGVNLKAAKALGVVIPESIVKEAVLVIE